MYGKRLAVRDLNAHTGLVLLIIQNLNAPLMRFYDMFSNSQSQSRIVLIHLGTVKRVKYLLSDFLWYAIAVVFDSYHHMGLILVQIYTNLSKIKYGIHTVRYQIDEQLLELVLHSFLNSTSASIFLVMLMCFACTL